PDHRGKPNHRSSAALIWILAFSVWLFVSTFKTPDPTATQSDWFNTYFKSLVVFVMALFFIESQKSILQFELTVVISAAAMMLVGFYQFHSGGGDAGRLESVGMFGDPNDLAAVVILALPFAVAPTLRRGKNVVQQALGFLFAVCSLLVIWLTRSRGAMLSLVMQVLTMRLVKATKGKWLGFLLLASVFGLLYVVALQAIPRQSGDMEASTESRITYWKAAINMTIHNPLWGVGYDRYPDNYEAYSSGIRYEWGRRTAHSSWFLAFAETGFIGGFLYLGFFISVLRQAWRNRVRRPEQLYSLAGYGVAMSFLSHTYALDVFLLAGLILASAALPERLSHGS
ncbi:MAG TPA: O-antigen ligase family protein, partial [Elusimicrobiota bacterium]|nr:O-antigen ligase family protein [Elusimicrobiota bacterium]